MPVDASYEKIYYERRSKQYADNPTILATQKINFRLLIQSIVSLFLEKPNYGYIHEAKLLQEFQNIIFVDNQSFFPYYVAPCLLLLMDTICREREDRRFCSTYKYQLLYVLAVDIAGFPPDINKGKVVDEYCARIINVFSNKDCLKRKIENSLKKFNEIVDSWVKLKGESYYHGVKSNQDFNEYLLRYLHEAPTIVGKVIDNTETEYRGTVIKVLIDKNNKYYGFISRMPENIFFHSNDNKSIDFVNVYAKDVMYKVVKDFKQNERAIVTKVIQR